VSASRTPRARHARVSVPVPDRWTRTLAFILTGGLILAAAVLPAPQAQALSECPEVLPAAEVVPGETGYGLTVSRGTTPERFDVEVVGVLENAVAPGIPLLVVEVASPEIDRVGGIWGGMSGSPVYVDGRLLGAVAYGFSWGPSSLGGVTPAEAMLRVPGRPTLPAPVMPAEIELPSEMRSLAIEDGVARSEAGTMRPLEIPVRVSGPAGAKLDGFVSSFEQRYPGTRVVRGTGGAGWEQDGAESSTIVPGGNLAVSLAIGDYTAVGIGTATYLCGETVLGFGHPLLYDGPTRLGLHGARAIRVVDDAVWGPYKLANAGPLVGTIDQDRLAGVAGRLGSLPVTTAVTSEIVSLDDASTTTGRTDVIHPHELFWPILVHGWINYDLLVFDNLYVSGSSEVEWSIEGLREDGSAWQLIRSNRHASQYDLSTESLIEMAMYADLLGSNPAEQVRVTSVDHRARAGTPYQALQIVGHELKVEGPDGELLDTRHGIELIPGTTIRIVVPLREFRGEVRTVDVELEVPADAAGYGELVIAGGGSMGMDGFFECFYDYSEDCGEPPARTFDELLAHLAAQPRNDELVVSLLLYGEDHFSDDEEPSVEELFFDGEQGIPTIRTSVQLDQVVSGSAYVEVFTAIEPEPDPDDPDPAPAQTRTMGWSCPANGSWATGTVTAWRRPAGSTPGSGTWWSTTRWEGCSASRTDVPRTPPSSATGTATAPRPSASSGPTTGTSATPTPADPARSTSATDVPPTPPSSATGTATAPRPSASSGPTTGTSATPTPADPARSTSATDVPPTPPSSATGTATAPRPSASSGPTTGTSATPTPADPARSTSATDVPPTPPSSATGTATAPRPSASSATTPGCCATAPAGGTTTSSTDRAGADRIARSPELSQAARSQVGPG
jgi:hypothetical protein